MYLLEICGIYFQQNHLYLFKDRLPEDENTQLCTSYWSLTGMESLNISIKKPIPYRFDCIFPFQYVSAPARKDTLQYLVMYQIPIVEKQPLPRQWLEIRASQ